MSALRTNRRSPRGFSLLEVMVSVAILGLAITVILSAQGGLAASNKNASNIGTAIHAGTCSMSEIEEKLMKMGYPEIDQCEDRPCCDEKDPTGFTCNYCVDRVILPNPPSTSLDGGLSLGGSLADGGGLDPLGGAGLNLDAGLQGIGSSVMGQFGAGGAGGGAGAQGLLQMAFGIVYPSLKPVMEASIRRITIKVSWKEGLRPFDYTIVQYVTNPQRGGLIGGVMDDGGVPTNPTGGTTGGPGGAGTGAPTGTGGGRGGNPFGGAPFGATP